MYTKPTHDVVTNKSMLGLANKLMVDLSSVTSRLIETVTFSEMCEAFLLFLIIHVTVKRSFSSKVFEFEEHNGKDIEWTGYIMYRK